MDKCWDESNFKMTDKNHKPEVLKYIWIFQDENLKIFVFKTFKEARAYLNKYDKDIRFVDYQKDGATHIYVNSWNEEDVYLTKIDLRGLYRK